MAGHSVKTPLTTRHGLAGLQAGIFGALLMVACMMAGSLLKRRSVWILPNLFATTFYGSAVYRNQFLRASWSGIALILAIYALGGVIWGLLWGEERRSLAPFYGALTGLLVYFVFFNLIWKVANPLLPLYAPTRQLEFAHVLWGLALSRSPLYSRRIAHALMPPPVQPHEAEARTGEVIR
ncbi:MAG: hypothetical protein M3N54_11080 [Acidobacteriota bacterium]|nr:hypothetical protein [Acidobacteriota bacterium]